MRWGLGVIAATILVGSLGSAAGATSPTVVTSIAVGQWPWAIAVDSQTSRAYVVNTTPSSTSIISTKTDSVVGALSTPSGEDVDVNPQTDRVYVATPSGTLVFNGATNQQLSTIQADGEAVAVDPATDRIYVMNGADCSAMTLAVVDGSTSQVLKTISLPRTEQDYGSNCSGDTAVDSSTNRVYVVSGFDWWAVSGATDAILASGNAGAPIGGVAVDAAADRFYLNTSPGVAVFDGSTNAELATIAASASQAWESPGGIAVNPATHRVYEDGVTCTLCNSSRYEQRSFVVIDGTTDQVVGSLDAGVGEIAVDVTNYRVFAVNQFVQTLVPPSNPNTVSVIADGSPPPDSYSLSVSKVGSGSGKVTSEPAGISCGSGCTHSFASGSTVMLTAHPKRGSRFVHWSGSCSGTTRTCSVAMTAGRSVRAKFARK